MWKNVDRSKSSQAETIRYTTAFEFFRRTGLNKLIIGTTESFFPINFKDDDLTFKGYTIDLCDVLGKYFNVDVEYQGYNNVCEMIKGLQKKEVNIIASSITTSRERRQIVNFSAPYFENNLGIIVSSENKHLKDWREFDLAHIKIAVPYGSAGHTAARIMFKKAAITKYDTLKDAGQALLTGQADAVIENSIWVKSFERQNSGTSILARTIGLPLPASIAVNYGQASLLEALNVFLSQYCQSTIHKNNYQKWLA